MRKIFINKQMNAQKSMKALFTFLLLICTTMVYSQTGVTGTVTDITGEPLIGVNVAVKGTTTGDVTNIDGRFSIQQVPASAVLVFSYIGFMTQEITVGNQRTINVQMREDTQGLEELIVVGYGTRKAGEMTGAVSTVRMEEIQRIPAVTAGEALRNVPGLMVTQSYTPGSSPNVRVRGMGTINDTSPLWVVDGVPGGTVNPNDIETVTVLKDAAAQAIYGTRAANGVILVTTKQGKRNERANVTINFRTGIQQHTNHYKMLNTLEYGQLIWLEMTNDGNVPSHQLYGTGAEPSIPDYINPARGVIGQVDESQYRWSNPGFNLITRANKEGTDWFDVIERNALFTDAAISVTGGSDKTVYSFNFGYVDQNGVLEYTSFDRFNLRSNIRTDVNQWLTVGQTLSATFSNQYGQLTNNAEDSAISWAYRVQPIIPVYDVGGNFAGSRAAPGPLGNSRNPLGILHDSKDRHRERMNLTGTVFANLNLFEGLQFRTQAGLNYDTYREKNISFYDISHSEGTTLDYVYMTARWTKQWNWSNILEYKKRIDIHDFTVMAGLEAINNDYYEMAAQRNNYLIRNADYMELSSGIDGQQNSSAKRSWALFSIFGRVNYVFDSKYLFEGVIRRDGSSRFAAGNRYGVFPAFSAGWVISRESFMAPTRSWLDNLKLRAGYGLTGNDQMDNYNSYSTYIFQLNDTQGSIYGLNGANGQQGTIGFRQDLMGVADVKWEATRTTNVGIDAAFLGGFNLTFDVWQRRTTDMLYPQAIPMVFGRVTTPSVNVGEMKNTGFDLDLGYRGTALNRELTYQLNMNISRYKNEIVSLGNDRYLEGGGFRQQVYTRSEVGHAFPEFFGYIVDGIFQNQAEVDAHATYGTYNAVGRYKFKDISGPDGVPDGRITVDDRTYLGSPHPDFVGGLNFNLEYKGFDLNGQFYGSYGNKVVNYVRRWLDYNQFIGGRSWESLYKSWGSPYLVGEATIARAETNVPENQNPSTVFIEDASYLRLRNLQVGYNLGKLFNTPIISTMRVYAQITNLFTLTKYSGLDPETNSATDRNNARNYGIDQGQWPTPRQIMVGITLGL